MIAITDTGYEYFDGNLGHENLTKHCSCSAFFHNNMFLSISFSVYLRISCSISSTSKRTGLYSGGKKQAM